MPVPNSIDVLKSDIDVQLRRPPQQIAIIKLVDDLVRYAYNSRASDVHIDPAEKDVAVRLRIDGVLHNSFTLPKQIQPEIISRIKVLAGIRTDEHQAAQDGRIRFLFLKPDGNFSFDIRVSIAPTYYGEDAVLRLLAQRGEEFILDNIGFSEPNLQIIKRAVKKPYGMVLATGPTGSGKTTTLYAILKTLNTPEVSIITIEDPIEYSLSGVEQIQVNQQTGLTFADGLRSILRQDPNIIMVGEIRDDETASIAVNAALTGHLLLSTLHTNDAATTLPRLLDMGVEPFLIGSTVNIAVGQRLVRRICQGCKTSRSFTPAETAEIMKQLPPEVAGKPVTFFQGKGCDACGKTGYQGRIGIHEVLEVTDAIRAAIATQKNAAEIRTIAVGEGMITMFEDGIQKALSGVTTFEEVLRAIRE